MLLLFLFCFITLRKLDVIRGFDIIYLSLCSWIFIRYIDVTYRCVCVLCWLHSTLHFTQLIVLQLTRFILLCCFSFRCVYVQTLRFVVATSSYIILLHLAWSIVLWHAFAYVKFHFVTISPLYVMFHSHFDSFTMIALCISNLFDYW